MTNENSALLSSMEIDVIGEVMNISMGSGATALSTVLDAKVNITTPRIEVVPVDQFEFQNMEPAIGVSIKYVEGIDGVNVLLLKEVDLKRILCHLLGMESPEEVAIDEIAESAICEIMNQMMGSSASALAQFLGKPINISPPELLDSASHENVKQLFEVKGNELVSIKFDLNIEGLVDSEFISAMDPALVKEIVNITMGGGIGEMDLGGLEEEAAPASEPAPAQAPQPAPAPQTPAPQAQPAPAPQPMPEMQGMQGMAPQMQMPMQEPQVIQPINPQMQMPQGMPMYAQPQMMQAQGVPMQPMYAQPQMMQPQMMPQQNIPAQQVNAAPYTYKQLGEAIGIDLTDSSNLELIMSVPIKITVELGTTKKKIKDIVDLCQGNIVELDRQAGDQVDILANGRLIAKGDVVVVDDNYSVRVTEIVKRENDGIL